MKDELEGSFSCEPPTEQPPEIADIDELHTGRTLANFRFSWRKHDGEIRSRIEAVALEMVNDLFGAAIDEVDRFYEIIRRPVLRNGSRVVDSRGRQVWETENGRLVEDWDQITGQDVEQTVMNLTRLKMSAAVEVNRLKNEAVFAKMIADDVKHDSWGKILSGTISDREARVSRDSREDRYHSYFRYYLWSNADVLLREITDFLFRIRDFRNWRIQSQ